jgi:hypothetical protein
MYGPEFKLHEMCSIEQKLSSTRPRPACHDKVRRAGATSPERCARVFDQVFGASSSSVTNAPLD